MSGIVIIEHTRYQGPEHVGEGDPFGVRPVVMPYILTEWFGHKINFTESRFDLNAILDLMSLLF